MPCRPQKATSCKKQPGVGALVRVPPEYNRVRVGPVYRFRFRLALSPSRDYISLYGIDKVHRRFLYLPRLDPPRARPSAQSSASFSPVSEFDILHPSTSPSLPPFLTFSHRPFFLSFFLSFPIERSVSPRNRKQIFADRTSVSAFERFRRIYPELINYSLSLVVT